MKVWITKYALTEGIQAFEAEVTSTSENMIETRPDSGYRQYFHGEGKDWHRSMEAARVRAEAVRRAKIKSVKKQLERLESMTF